MMLNIKDMPIYVATKPIDFRSAIDGLCMLITGSEQNPQEGIYVFYNKGRNKLKLLCWHHNGFILIYKRLEKGRFFLECNPTQKTLSISNQQCAWLLQGLDWQLMSAWGSPYYKNYG